MQDVLDRAFFLVLPSACKEVLPRRTEVASGSGLYVEPELFEALDLYGQRKLADVENLLTSFLEDSTDKSSLSIAYASTLLARCYSNSGKSSQGLKLLESHETSRHFVGPLQEANLLWLLAGFYRVEQRYLEAKEALQKAHDLILISSVPKFAFRIVSDIANIHVVQGDAARAIALYEMAISGFGDDEDESHARTRALLNLASVYQRVSKEDEALRIYEDVLQRVTANSDWKVFVAVKLNRAIALKSLNRIQDSFEAYEDVRRLSEAFGDWQYEIRALIGLSDLGLGKEDAAQARDFVEQAMSIATDRQSLQFELQCKRRLAGLEQKGGKVESAAQILRDCYDHYVAQVDYREAIDVANDLVDLYAEAEQYKRALEMSLESSRIQKTIYSGEIERSVEIAAIRERYVKEKEAVRVRDEERTKILHAVMPAHIAARLTAGERQIVDTLSSVTILFADVVGFTELVSSMSGEALLDLLSKLFAGLDLAASRFGCERIKTIGDSYMAICGASEAVEDHTERMVRMALSVVKGEVPLPFDPSRLRIGINTGPVIAGVMDGQRIAYDVWGDTVNVAARMEEHSRPGAVHCTEAVAQRLVGLQGISLIKREPIAIQGKGLMTTYFIELAM